MARGVLYLDIDDEITSAASRVRGAEGRRVAVVLPYGSRLATSRINFRLLARDATSHEKRLAVVAGDPGTRALAASAGLPVFATVAEYEASLVDEPERQEGAGSVGLAASATVVAPPEPATLVPPPDGDAGRAGTATAEPAIPAVPPTSRSTGAGEADPGDTTLERTAPMRRAERPGGPGLGVPAGAGAGAGLATASAASAAPAAPIVIPRHDRRDGARRLRVGRTPIVVGLGILALALVVGGVAAYLLLPSATIAITPREETVGPVPFQVTASTTATEPDPEAGIVPAVVIDIGVEASDSFEATGRRVEEETARGRVRFDNLDPTTSNRIAAGAIVSTGSGVRFRTDRAVEVPPAKLTGLQIEPSSASVAVTAVDPGPEGNVEPNAITTIPRGEEPIFLKVRNPDGTSGGTRTEFPRVREGDVEAAVEALTEALRTRFAERLEDPDLTTDGATVFPDTAQLGEPVFAQDLEALVGEEVETFELGASATGTVTAVDAAPVQSIAEERLAGSIDEGYQLVDGSSEITVDPGVVTAGTIRFPVTVTARQVLLLDPGAIETEIAGRSLEEARSILDRYGAADLAVWPDWVATIPTIDGRVTITIDGPTIDGAGEDEPASEGSSPP